MISLKNVSVGYEDKKVLENITLDIKPGKVLVLIGPNGCGKSTLLKSLVRIQKHMDGEIFVDEKKIESYKSQDLAKKIAYLAQSKKIPDISVLRMVLHGRFPYLSYPRKYRKEDIEIARKAIAWAGITELEEENVSHLSGGMQQKVYIAMAIAQDAETILMDEPTTYLDICHQLKLMDMAKSMAASGKAVVMVLHDLSQALQVADEVVVLNNGQMLIHGNPEEVLQSGSIEEAFGIEMVQVETKRQKHYVCRWKED